VTRYRNFSSSATEPVWISLDKCRSIGIPEHFYQWLKDSGSLTDRIIDACRTDFRVRLLRQKWSGAKPSEAQLLNMRTAEVALIREVELLCGGKPWVFARTIIPASSVSGGARRLTKLKEKPLGAVLFSNPATSRKIVQVAHISPRYPLYKCATANLGNKPKELWGRRTLFLFSKQPLLVNEIFLPGIPEL
jgi:chorismate--pyruvate lyase